MVPGIGYAIFDSGYVIMSKVYDFNDERKKTQRSDARGKVNVFNT
jgi:hypothetical protein